MIITRSLCVILCAFALTGIFTAQEALASVPEPRVRHILLTVGSGTMTVDGAPVQLDAAPAVIGGSTLVPLRAIFDALGAEVSWHGGDITAVKDCEEIRLSVGSRDAWRGSAHIRLAVKPQVINGRTMVPLRFVAESLGAEVEWVPEGGHIRIAVVPEGARWVRAGGVRLFLGDPAGHVRALIGQPSSTELSAHDFKWDIYSGDYGRFWMVGIKDGRVAAIYTTGRDFETYGGAKHGDAGARPADADANPVPGSTKLYYDNNRVYAVRLLSAGVTDLAFLDESFYRSQERVMFHVTNAFRASLGVHAVWWDEAAASVARGHSADMEARNFAAHICPDGVKPEQRLTRGGVSYRRMGENFGRLSSGSQGRFGIDAVDYILTSEGHRSLLLHEMFVALGIGVYGRHFTQNFHTSR